MNNNSDSVHKFLGLEVLRFLAAMSVLVVHYGHFAWSEANPSDFTSGVPFYRQL